MPSGSIKQIRTSQFSTDPEKVVRIVFDVAGALTYKVKGDGNTFTLQINTPSDKDFPKWSAAGWRIGANSLRQTKTEVVSKSDATKKAETPAKAEVASKSEVTKKTETPVKTEVASKSEATKKTQLPTKTEVVSKSEATKKVETPVKSATKPDKSDSKLAAKPIDESKLLTKVTKSKGTTPPEKTSAVATTPAISENQSVAQTKPATSATSPTGKTAMAQTTQPSVAETKALTATPVVPSKVSGEKGNTVATGPVLADKVTKSQPKGVTQPAGSEASGTKRADSATMPQTKPTQGAPATEPVDLAKPPKVQKTALPETKVVKTPKYTESPEAGNALTGKIATALEGGKAVDGQPTGEKTSDTVATTGAVQSKSDSVRQRYLASRNRNLPPEAALPDSMAAAGSESERLP